MNSLFLHFGPGGSAFVDRQWLSQKWTAVDFWDQPKVGASTDSFEELTEKIGSKLLQSSPQWIIGHSFGCDLALAVADSFGDRVAGLTLLSPMVSIPQCFVNFARRLGDDGESLSKPLSTYEKTKSVDDFWPLAMAVAADSRYMPNLWAHSDILAKYLDSSKGGPAFDGAEWFNVLNSFFKWEKTHNRLGILKKINKINIVMGDRDPYYNLTEEHGSWSQVIGSHNIRVIEGAGHFVHLEDSETCWKEICARNI